MMIPNRDEPRWWEWYANIVKLLDYLANEPAYTKADMLAAVEQPWKYGPEATRAGVEGVSHD